MTRQGLIALSIILEERPKTDRNRYARFARPWVVVVPSYIAHSTTSFIRTLDNYILSRLISQSRASIHRPVHHEMDFRHCLHKKNQTTVQTIKIIFFISLKKRAYKIKNIID